MDQKKGLVDYDRISNLPDDIICHILSFIPTKFSVRTRILSKRWKQLFTFVPVLDFSCPHLDPNGRFLDFVTWVFSSYNVNQMDRFCYNFGHYRENPFPQLHFWISESIRRGVRELNVTEYFGSSLALPSCIFTCETLTYLKVQGGFNLVVPDDVHLPHLKTLHLFSVSFSDACSVARFFRSCPVLEDLSFHFCLTAKHQQTLDVSNVLSTSGVVIIAWFLPCMTLNYYIKHVWILIHIVLGLTRLLTWSVMCAICVSLSQHWRLLNQAIRRQYSIT